MAVSRSSSEFRIVLKILCFRLSNKSLNESRFSFHSFQNVYDLFPNHDIKSIQTMMRTVNTFSASTGLVINPNKCRVYCGGMDRDAKETMSQASGFEEGKLLMKYLGVPITYKRLTINQYMPLIEKIVHRLKHWIVNLLSYSGRIMLVKSVILAIAQYWMQCIPLPQTVIEKIDRLCRTFIWTGNTELSKKSPMAWSNVCRPKS
ncbi:uncharacterized protein LOC131605715 [Vicia villosa]|uniref:uncharacterized protein LOC131605715 n=1 Tax=Vicia villosa TaxID=3911 RepID=UPI00273B7F5E|nr:uncharacterized protein LOC131605715 [Vicia villosa]